MYKFLNINYVIKHNYVKHLLQDLYKLERTIVNNKYRNCSEE